MVKQGMFVSDPDMEQLEVTVSELLVATAEQSDALVDESVTQVLRILRERLGMDVVFVAEFDGDEHVIRQVANPEGLQVHAPGEVRPLEQTWCHHVVEGRLPRLIPDTRSHPAVKTAPDVKETIGAFMTTPITLPGQGNYGTLCTYSFTPHDELGERQLSALEQAASHIAKVVIRRRSG